MIARRQKGEVAGGGLPAAEERARRLLEALRLQREGWPVSGETRSMVPLLEGGDRIFWRAAGARPRLGEVLVFAMLREGAHESERGDAPRDPGGKAAPLAEALAGARLTLVVHRVVGRERGGRIITKGDGRPARDVELVEEAALVGVVEALERGGVRRDLRGPRARGYALAALAISRGGEALFRLATLPDALVDRLLGGGGGRWFLRRPAWWAQRAAQELLFAIAHRLCHPRARGA